jgi:hypothetical protein
MSKLDISNPSYWKLFYEPFDWITACLLHRASPDSTQRVFALLKQCSNVLLVKSFFVNASLERFQEDSLISVSLIEQCFEHQFQLSVDQGLLTTFADTLARTKASHFNLPLSQKRQILNQVWPLVGKLKGVNYANTVKALIPFVGKHFTCKELRTCLQEALHHLAAERASAELQPVVLEILLATLQIDPVELGRLVQTDTFQQLYEFLQERAYKSEAAKAILNEMLKMQVLDKRPAESSPSTALSDPTVFHTLLQYCKTIHDSIDCFSLDDERRQVERILLNFMNLIDFNTDLETRLNFLTEFRANFSLFDSVINQTIHCALLLAIRSVSGKEFSQACLAFAIVTIPSLAVSSVQLQLYLQSAQVSLQCACLPQTDLFLKSSITLLSKIFTTNETPPSASFLCSYLANLLSFLLVVPV